MKDRAEVLMYNKCFGNAKELVQQFNEVRQLNAKVSKPVLHITLSLAPGENVSRNKLMEMCEDCAKEMVFENNQFLAVSHRDTNHQHVHIVVNRIGFDMRTVSDSNNYQKIANYCRKMEQKYELQQVISPRKFLSKTQRSIPRFDKRKEQLREHIKESLKGCATLSQFEHKMKDKGYRIVKGRGISFADEKKVTVKGSELNYSLQTIERILEKQRTFDLSKNISNPLLQKQHELSEGILQKHQENKKGALSILIEGVTKPEHSYEETDKDMLPEKRKKKRHKSKHL